MAIPVLLAVSYPPGAITFWGLITVIGSALISMIAALRGIGAAKKVAHLTVGDFVSPAPPVSHTFDSTYGLMGRKSDRIDEVERHLQSLQNELLLLHKDSRDRQQWNDGRFSQLLALIKYHQEVVLPKSFATSARTMVIGSFLAIVGSACLADVATAHQLLSDIGNSSIHLVRAAMGRAL